MFLNNRDLYINFKNNNSSMILVTGISGSGKSTLSKELSKKYKFEIISFDMIFEYQESREKNELEIDILNKFNESYPDYKNNDKKVLCNIFFDFVAEYITTKNISIIFDGSQFLKKVDFEKIKDQRIVLKGTSLLVSLIRRTRRNMEYIRKNNYPIIRKLKEVYWLHLYNIKNIFRWINDRKIFLENVKKGDLYYER